MPSFEEYAKTYVVEALERTPDDVAPDVYVVSLFAYDEEDDPRKPTLTIGFNTESQVAATIGDASDADEARWNFAFWLQNELGVLGGSHRDAEGAALREEWIRSLDLWYSDEEEDADFDAAMEKGGQSTARFVELAITITQQLHAEGTIARIFGRPIPVLIHELEYYDEIAEQNQRANPEGLADGLTRWIDGL
jgi:hypothetical protein